MMNCDPETGACQIPEAAASNTSQAASQDVTLHYIGDPMCSWCWGISPALKAAETFCAEHGIGFTVNVGGLRVGGGDPWTAPFKAFLRKEWNSIREVSGQPFGFTILDREEFNYDTEPVCRAVVTVQLLQARNDLPASVVLEFFTALQRRFYVDGADPRELNFYQRPCEQVGIDFAGFSRLFLSDEARQAVHKAFQKRQEWGVTSFPTVLLESRGEFVTLAKGFISAEQLIGQLRHAVAA